LGFGTEWWRWLVQIPGLSTFIHDMVHATLGPMMYEPNVFTLNLEQLMSGVPLDTSIGVLQITIISAQALKGNKFSGGDPDPYVAICVNNDTTIESTRWKENTRNPHWQETKFILLSSLSGMLNLKVLDYNTIRQHDDLGLATWDLAGLAEDATQEAIIRPVTQQGKPRGELKFDLYVSPPRISLLPCNPEYVNCANSCVPTRP
jgi:Ca2+-dependent lipid-binding protein